MSTDTGPSHEPTTPDADLRDRARRRIEQKRGFWLHLAIYLAFNGTLVVVWAWTGAAFFWALFPMVLWGIGVAANAWVVFAEQTVSEERVQREIDRMRR